MSESLKIEELLKENTELKEVEGGENWSILHGDTLKRNQ